MSSPVIISGPMFAVVVPFNGSDKIDLPVFRDYLAWLGGKGAAEILVNGTTGEFTSLTLNERETVMEAARASFPGTVIVNVSATSTKDACALCAHAAGYADAILLSPPYYYSDPPAEGVAQFLDAVLETSSLPAYLYNIPQHTGVTIGAELLVSLASRHECVVGLKDSSGQVPDRDVMRAGNPALRVFLGNDALASSVRNLDVTGIVTGAGNALPELPIAIAAALSEGDGRTANIAQDRLDRWNAFWPRHGGEIACVKAALGARIPGFPTRMRPPLVAISPAACKALESGMWSCLDGVPDTRGRRTTG